MIKIEPDKDLCSWPLEVCCFCRKQTNYWTRAPHLKPGEQLACCEKCAKVANYEDLPTKRQWCNREEIVRKGLK